eukprot:scaffold2.g7310.t1
MAALACTTTAALATSGRATRPRCVSVRAQQQPSGALTRREATLAAAAAALAVFAPPPAHAGLFGVTKKDVEEYESLTVGSKVIADVLEGATLERDAPDREPRLRATRDEMNRWVAKYRRDQAFSGRPSFGNTYGAVNALAGHLNSFGYSSPVPKKRLERLVKELDDAQKQLARGR